MQVELRQTSIAGLVELFPKYFEDSRGLFLESFNVETFRELGLPTEFVQDNQSYSHKGVLRGLHFQLKPFAQGKLVSVLSGRVLDVAVDLRPGSPTFGKHETFILERSKFNMAYIPPGFAHGFVALEDSVFFYKCTQRYHKESERGIKWDDAELGIDWGVSQPIISDKDQQLPGFREFMQSVDKSLLH